MQDTLRRQGRLVASVLGLLVAAACQRGFAGEEAKPIPECQAYEREVARCTGRHEKISTQPAALATAGPARQRMQQLCLVNIQRLKEACR